MSLALSGTGDSVWPASVAPGASVEGEPAEVGEGPVPTVPTEVGEGVVPTPPADVAATDPVPVGATHQPGKARPSNSLHTVFEKNEVRHASNNGPSPAVEGNHKTPVGVSERFQNHADWCP